MSTATSTPAVVLQVSPLGFPWQTFDPFLFCVHHDDAYPEGNEKLGPNASLEGRDMGQDFAGKDGWRMYHGDEVPGFPQHPHRGFETVTIMRQGYIDHWDSLGATARFGQGDTQWLTAGKGIVHCEMFPLLEKAKPNPAELFQIWLNLPRESKMVDPYFSMFWKEAIPVFTHADGAGRKTTVDVVAGNLGGVSALPPPPDSWGARDASSLGIWTVKMEANAEWTLPPAPEGVNRTLYFFVGKTLSVGGRAIPLRHLARLRADAPATIVNGDASGDLLILQGRPIGETVAQHGPFVMNTTQELQQAFTDYQRTRFGGWPWPSNEPVHPRTQGRFARHPDGRIETAGEGSRPAK